METYSFSVGEADTLSRIDAFLATQLQMTRSAVVRLMTDGHVLINGLPTVKSNKLKPGDTVTVTVPEPIELNVAAEDIPLDIVYEDNCLLVVNKPQGMVVHPAPGNYNGTLVNALLFHCRDSLSGINGVLRPGIVHRIDKDTSGLLIVAKNDIAHQALAAQIKEHSFTRQYEAVVTGIVKADTGEINLPIGRHPVKRKQMAVTDQNSKPAKTQYRVLQRGNNLTHVQLTLFTGRTHQIRVHMAYIGHPLAGDPLYGHGAQYPSLHGQCLHARKIGFIHPQTQDYMEFTSELPAYFTEFLKERGLYGAV